MNGQRIDLAEIYGLNRKDDRQLHSNTMNIQPPTLEQLALNGKGQVVKSGTLLAESAQKTMMINDNTDDSFISDEQSYSLQTGNQVDIQRCAIGRCRFAPAIAEPFEEPFDATFNEPFADSFDTSGNTGASSGIVSGIQSNTAQKTKSEGTSATEHSISSDTDLIHTASAAMPLQAPCSSCHSRFEPIEPYNQPYPITVQNIQYLNGFIRSQVGRRVHVEFLIGTSNIVEKDGYLVAVGANFILLNPLDTKDILACDFYNIKFMKFYY